MAEPSFTIGIEEEYLLVDAETRALVTQTSPALLETLTAALGDQVSSEFLQCQIEIGTQPHATVQGARADLARLRGTVAAAAAAHGMRMIAAATHPWSDWHDLKHTDKARYDFLAESLQEVVARLAICGQHVHVAIEDDELRVDLMNQVTYFLPHILALSTSSPYWQGRDTGLNSYRLSIWDAMPRTGLPGHFNSYGEYQRLVESMVSMGVIPDATMIWWDIRPSARYPTLEMRIADVATRLEDALTVAALYQCLLRFLWRLRRVNQRWRLYPLVLIDENRWRAQRYGCEGELLDLGRTACTKYPDLIEEILALVAEDAEALDCVAEVNRARRLAACNTSAHHQRLVFAEAKAHGATDAEALVEVVDWLAETSVEGTAAEGTLVPRAAQ